MTGTDAITETYANVEKLIHSTVHAFARTCKQPYWRWDEMMSEAHAAFMEAYGNYDPSRGAKFSSHLRNRIWWTLLDWRVAQAKEGTRPVESLNGNAEGMGAKPLPVLARLTAELGDDAATVARLACRLDFLPAMRPGGIRRELAAMLRGMGWGWARIIESFGELRNSIR